ncbi:hypothetical protein ACQEU3_46615 [Spirillospora sp. CA-253888]
MAIKTIHCGTWSDYTLGQTTPEDALSEVEPQDAYNLDAIAADYRALINDLLRPDNIRLVDDEFVAEVQLTDSKDEHDAWSRTRGVITRAIEEADTEWGDIVAKHDRTQG